MARIQKKKNIFQRIYNALKPVSEKRIRAIVKNELNIVKSELIKNQQPAAAATLKDINNLKISKIARNVDSLTKPKKNMMDVIWEMEIRKSAEYVRKNMWQCERFDLSEKIWSYALDNVTLEGLHLEFGVFQGKSINFFARSRPDTVFHGFDSFIGLPDRWVVGREKGHFSLEGDLPFAEGNVKLHKGFFDASIPEFAHPLDPNEKIAFLHVDCDMYESTKTIFDLLGNRIVEGTIILFDEYLNYPGWEDHEVKAFKEYIETSGAEYEYMAFHEKYTPVLTRITKSPTRL